MNIRKPDLEHGKSNSIISTMISSFSLRSIRVFLKSLMNMSENLRAAVQRSDRFAFWSSTQGCVSTWLDFMPVRDVPQESQISEVSPKDFEVSPTMTFGATTTIPICLSEHEGKHGFIANGSIPWESIESIWHSCLKKTDDQEGTIFRNIPDVKILQSFSPVG